MIYFIRRPSDGAIKIGTTIRLSQRLAAHRSAFGHDLELIGTCGGGRAEEQELHRTFEHLRIGIAPLEWFTPDDDLAEHISRNAKPWDGLDEASEVGPSKGYRGYSKPKDAQLLSTYLPSEHLDRLRVLAARKGLSAPALACQALMAYIEESEDSPR